MGERPDPPEQSLAEHWSSHQGGTESFSPLVYWLAVPEVQERFQSLSTGGQSVHWVNYCLERFLGGRTPVERMASLGCGTGALERHLALLQAFRRCDGFDSFNVTVTAPTSSGNVRLFLGGTPTPTTSNINFSAGQTRANNGIVALGTNGDVGVLLSPAGTAHVIIDVNGYME